MNIIKTLIARIDERLAETKNPCPSYATEAKAEQKTREVADKAGQHFDREKTCARYVVFFHPGMQRWVGAVDMTELVRRPSSTGGYLGICGKVYSY